jgi:glyoxalase/bleomycin resistance protein/dioxygenase superfamily protein
MEPIICDMVQRYERGGLTRRQLIQGLAILVAAAQAPVQSAAQQGGQPPASPDVQPIVATGIDHISVLASDVERSQRFYQDLFSLSVLSEDKEHGIVRLGRKRVIVSLRKEKPYGTVDHFGVGVAGFNKEALTRNLQARGLKPQENWQYGFFVKDPDGVNVQFI